MTARQIRILTNAAIDASPKLDDEEDEWVEGSPSDQKSQPTPEMDEAGRRRHRHFLRKREIKPSGHLAERLRTKAVNIPKGKKPVMKKSSPKMGKGNSVDTMGDLMLNAMGNQSFSVSDKAKRLMQLGGYN